MRLHGHIYIPTENDQGILTTRARSRYDPPNAFALIGCTALCRISGYGKTRSGESGLGVEGRRREH